MDTTGKVEHQGAVVDLPADAPAGTEAVIQEGQGLVFKTEAGRFGTLGADGFYHGYVPSTQVRDILNGQGNDVTDEPTTALDEAIEKSREQDAAKVAGSEAPAPTGDVEASTDPAIGPNIAEGNVGGKDELVTDHNPTMAPASKAELDDISAKGKSKS